MGLSDRQGVRIGEPPPNVINPLEKRVAELERMVSQLIGGGAVNNLSALADGTTVVTGALIRTAEVGSAIVIDGTQNPDEMGFMSVSFTDATGEIRASFEYAVVEDVLNLYGKSGIVARDRFTAVERVVILPPGGDSGSQVELYVDASGNLKYFKAVDGTTHPL